MLCLAAMAGGIMTRGASEGSLPSKRSAARHRAAKDSHSDGFLGKIADFVEGLADEIEGADEAGEMEMHKTSLDVDKDDDEDDEDEEDMTPAELRALSALQGFYGKDRLEEVAGIVDRGMAPGASEGDKERAQKYLDKAAKLVKGADADKGDEMEMHKNSFDEARADREADEVAEHVVHGVETIVDAVAPIATELLDAVLGDDEDEA